MDVPGALATWTQPRRTVRVLVADDNELMRTLIAAMLSRRGYDVVTVEDGPGVIEAAHEKVDVVILDLTMPRLNGLDVCRRLRSEPATAALPIIVLTGRTEPGDVRDALRAGASDFLTKPFEEDELLTAVQRLVRRRAP